MMQHKINRIPDDPKVKRKIHQEAGFLIFMGVGMLIMGIINIKKEGWFIGFGIYFILWGLRHWKKRTG